MDNGRGSKQKHTMQKTKKKSHKLTGAAYFS